MSLVVLRPKGGLVLGHDIRDLAPIIDVGPVRWELPKLRLPEPQRLAMADKDRCVEVIPQKRVHVVARAALGTRSGCNVDQRSRLSRTALGESAVDPLHEPPKEARHLGA